MTDRPVVLFVCVSNAGKSQMAAALLERRAGDAIEVHSAGTRPGASGINRESAASVAELGADMSGGEPKGIDPDLLRRADRVIVVGTAASVEPVGGMRADVETWATDEPSERGIEGAERMRLIRDEIDARVGALADELLADTNTETGAGSPSPALPNLIELPGGDACGPNGC